MLHDAESEETQPCKLITADLPGLCNVPDGRDLARDDCGGAILFTYIVRWTCRVRATKRVFDILWLKAQTPSITTVIPRSGANILISLHRMKHEDALNSWIEVYCIKNTDYCRG